MRGYEKLFVCGTDEYGTATEMKARESGMSPKEICDRYHALHRQIYDWFDIRFDVFGRTSTPIHTEIVQDIFRKVEAAGLFLERESLQFYDPAAGTYLADRYLIGDCPHCGHEEAHGDQCDKCGRLLSPEDLKKPRSSISGAAPELRKTSHLYLDLPSLSERLGRWIETSSSVGRWSQNTRAITSAWLREGLRPRAITRDLKWGVPVPRQGFQDKVFYVWFDAPIGYISMTAAQRTDWRRWWQDPENVELVQFMGKDNVPFHSVIFPSVLLGTSDEWTLVHHISTTEYLNYEGQKFSKSRGVGVFGPDVAGTGIPCDVWRYYLLSIRPEQQDTSFSWKDLQTRNNSELLANLGNLVNRVLSFVTSKLDGLVPTATVEAERDLAFQNEISACVRDYAALMEDVKLRDGLQAVMKICRVANRYMQDSQPWRTLKTDPEQAYASLVLLLETIRDVAVLVSPFLPGTAAAILSQLGLQGGTWEELGEPLPAGHRLGQPAALFAPISDETVNEMAQRFRS